MGELKTVLTVVFSASGGYRLVLNNFIVEYEPTVVQVAVDDLHRYLMTQLNELADWKKGSFDDDYEEPHIREDTLIFLILELSALGYLSFIDLNSLYTRLKKLKKNRPYRMYYA